MNLTTLSRSVGSFLSKNAPTIMTSVSVAGVLTTTVLAVKATPEACRRIDSLHPDCQDAQNKVKAVWKLYLPATISGLATITSIVAVHSTHNRRNAALMGVYTLTERAYKEYREEVISQDGENKDRKIKDEVAKKRIEEDPVDNGKVIFTGQGEHLCYDSLSGRYFKSSIERIRKAQNDINESVMNHMYVAHNDFYRLIGLEPIGIGEDLGWTTTNTMRLDFTSTLTEDNEPALYLDYQVTPIRDYYKFG